MSKEFEERMAIARKNIERQGDLHRKAGMLCAACGGLCRLRQHVPMRPATPSETHVKITYRIQTPVVFRAIGMLLYPVSDNTIIESMTMGHGEQLVMPVQARIFRPQYRIDQCEAMLMQAMCEMMGVVQLMLPVMENESVVQIVTNGPLTDFALAGVYLEPL